MATKSDKRMDCFPYVRYGHFAYTVLLLQWVALWLFPHQKTGMHNTQIVVVLVIVITMVIILAAVVVILEFLE